MLANLIAGVGSILQVEVILALAAGVGGGIILGSIPGLTATMAIAVVIPFTFYMDPVISISMLIGAYKGGLFGGSISAILLGTPGTDAAAATILDGNTMAKSGRPGKALKTALISSALGDMLSLLALIIIAPQLAKLTIQIGPGEFFALIIFSLTIIAGMGGESVTKGLIAAAFGLLIATIGLDPMVGIRRLTFGVPNLDSGIAIMPMLIGLFAVPEVIEQLEHPLKRNIPVLKKSDDPADNRLSFREFKRCIKSILIGSGIGVMIGAIPGVGSSISSWLSYKTAKDRSRDQEKWGTGIVEGVAAPEAGNNAICGGALIPMLTLGVPGSVPVAILMGAFLIQGIIPGPMIFEEAGPIVYGIFASLFASNLLLLIIGYLIITYAAMHFTKVPKVTLFPIIISFCFVGSFALNQAFFDVKIMVIFGILGYLMRKFGFAPAPFLIAMILEPFGERALRQFLMLNRGDFTAIFRQEIAVAFLILTAISILAFIRKQMKKSASQRLTGS
ncbi:MAG: tripartite tricarboxylate transporter permease [Desulfohalobiaceae bacterium]|nr:tripartite tricarboxylate transporter permease [Desulfohalobiaceae bacterium]